VWPPSKNGRNSKRKILLVVRWLNKICFLWTKQQSIECHRVNSDCIFLCDRLNATYVEKCWTQIKVKTDFIFMSPLCQSPIVQYCCLDGRCNRNKLPSINKTNIFSSAADFRRNKSLKCLNILRFNFRKLYQRQCFYFNKNHKKKYNIYHRSDCFERFWTFPIST